MIKLPKNLRSLLSRLDIYLILAAFLLLIFGVLVIWSANPILAQKQAKIALLGGALFILAAALDYKYIKRVAPLVFFFALSTLLSTLFFGHQIRGASRWLSLGPLSFQPSEIAKLGLCLSLPWLFGLQRISRTARFFASLVALTFSVGLVVLQPDLGTAAILVAIWAGTSFIAGVPIKHLLFLLFLGIISLPLGWYLLAPYQRTRIYAFLNPQADPLGSGYNVLQAIIAVGSGQVFGRGFGRGPQSQLRFLPERSTDFIFASLAEEWGLLGVGILLTLFFILLFRIFRVASRARDGFGALLCAGVFFMLLSQIVINIGMNLGVMPITGLPLPLISAGGSSLVVTLLSLGLVESVALRRED